MRTLAAPPAAPTARRAWRRRRLRGAAGGSWMVVGIAGSFVEWGFRVRRMPGRLISTLGCGRVGGIGAGVRGPLGLTAWASPPPGATMSYGATPASAALAAAVR